MDYYLVCGCWPASVHRLVIKAECRIWRLAGNLDSIRLGLRNGPLPSSKLRIASLGLRSVAFFKNNEEVIRSWRYGELDLHEGKLLRIRPRWWPRFGSQWESFQDSYIRTLPRDFLRAYYAFPVRAPGFMSVLYAQAGPKTQYKTLLVAMESMDEIAGLRNAQAIVCQLVSTRATERLMNRWGYVQHARSLGNNHYIKRLK